MRHLKCTLGILLLSSIPISGLFAQETGAPAATNAQEQQYESGQQISVDSLLKVARIIVESATCKALITVDEAGKPHAREMAPFAPEEDWVIWMGTTRDSRKTKQIMGNPNVVVFYYDTAGRSYVSVSGKARLVSDPDKKSKYWVDAWTAFYKDVDKDYILIEVTPENLEICSFEYNILWDSKGDSKLVDLSKK
jgi:general stress protein 26